MTRFQKKLVLAALVLFFLFWLCVPAIHATTQASTVWCVYQHQYLAGQAQGRYAWYSC